MGRLVSPEGGSRRGRFSDSRVAVLAAQAASIAALVLAWHVAVRTGVADPLFVPAPVAVVAALGTTASEALPRLGDTLAKALLGYVLAVGLGVTGGLLIGSRRLVHAVAMPYVVAAYGVPKILVLPWIALIFGLGTSTAVITATLFAVFPILLMVAAGVRDVDPTLVTAAVSMGATRGQVSRKVLLPAVLPSVLAGMRIGVVFAMLGVLLAEMFAGTRGMGFLMQRMAMAFKAADLFAATAVVSILSIVVVLSLEHLNQRLSRWR
ncbi:MAG TPA: ABC transporter permease subunit [Methylomirabilota bacterium]|nr:ABC transporter permease subunit [Methylomirabilota bacterium]